jgi:2-dehydro-3-deoxyphosphogluconate aldolase/(4S)-4-hydroxy-2-oxoglutarate aldolase
MTRLRRTMRQILARTPVMPVLTVHDVTSAAQLAGALVRGGVFVFEVLLRTPQALDAVKAMIEAAPEADIGLGTLLEPSDVLAAVEAGVAFGVSPGLTPALAQAVRSAGLPFLPGTSSASEVMFAREHGFREMKLFPAQGAAGIPWLRNMAPVFPDVLFCPTGSIKPADIPGYLALPNCCTVGGSWVAPEALVQAHDWPAISALARQSAAMKPV